MLELCLEVLVPALQDIGTTGRRHVVVVCWHNGGVGSWRATYPEELFEQHLLSSLPVRLQSDAVPKGVAIAHREQLRLRAVTHGKLGRCGGLGMSHRSSWSCPTAQCGLIGYGREGR